jgi:hypothetical protein
VQRAAAIALLERWRAPDASGRGARGGGDHVGALADGTAAIDGREHRWSTPGLYRFAGERLAGCWLLPLDPEAFDRIWR